MGSILFLVTIYGIVALSGTVHGGTNDSVCKQWTDIAQKVTGSGKIHNCTIRKPECSIMDCSGSTTFYKKLLPLWLKNDIIINYCFGMQINSCNNPLSMDFYLQVLSKNVSKVYRIIDDEEFVVKELNYSLGSIGTAYPVFNFMFERNNDLTVNLSVTGEVKMHSNGKDIPVPLLKLTLIDDMIIPTKKCDRIDNNPSKMSPHSFVPDNCKVKPYVPRNKTQACEKPSETLNKVCSKDQSVCGYREMCDLTLNPPKCTCIPDSQLSAKGDACLSTNTLNQTCVENLDCSDYSEECTGDSPETKTCQCRKPFTYNPHRDICTIMSPGGSTADASNKKCDQPHKGLSVSSDSVKASSSFGEQNIVIYVGVGLAAVVAIGLAIWVTMYYMRRKRQHLSISDRESSAPLIGNTDNLVM